MHFVDQTALGSNAIKIADQQHPQHQLGINRRATRVAVEVSQFVADHIKIQQSVDLAQQVIFGDVILNPEPVKQALLRFQPSHHRPILPSSKTIESAQTAPIKAEFFTSIDMV